MKIWNFLKTGTFDGEHCFDCGAENPFFKDSGSAVPKGADVFLCEECMDIRERYLDETGSVLPLNVICDGCRTNSHNEHFCSTSEAVVDGIRTKKSCSCEECAGVDRVQGPYF